MARIKDSPRNRLNVKVYPEEWELIKNERRQGETYADTVKRLLEGLKHV